MRPTSERQDDELPPVWEGPQAAGAPINLIGVGSKIVRRWPFVLLAGLGCGLLGLGLSYLLTPRFVSKAVFLPPQQQLPATDNALAMLFRTPSSAIYEGLLLSDSVLDDVVAHTNLETIFKARDREDARSRLAGIVGVSTDGAGFVTLSVTYKDPGLAKEIAANFLPALSRLNNRLTESEAAQQRQFFQSQLEQEKDALEEAEANVAKGQERSGVVSPASQTQAGLTAIDNARAQIREQQVVLAALLKSKTEQSPDVAQARSELQTMEGQLHALEQGQGATGGGLPASKAPSVNLEFVRLEREVKYHQALFDVMTKQYENARLEESSAAPRVQVVDLPEVPLRKSWPSRTLCALVGGFGGCLLALIVVFMRDRWNAVCADPANARPISELRRALTSPSIWP